MQYRLSEPAVVFFAVERAAAGRKVGKRCVAATRATRKRPPCTRWAPVKGTFAVAGRAGRNGFTFRGRVGGRSLTPGRYRLTGAAVDYARHTSALLRREFRIVR